MSEVWREWEAKRGRMSTKSMPGIGKSGNCRRAARRLIFVLASSEALAAEGVGWDSSLVALSLIAGVLADCAALGSCVGIAESEEKSGRRGEVRSVAQICKLIKTFLGWGRRRWLSGFVLDWIRGIGERQL